jgi:hypothetical protein
MEEIQANLEEVKQHEREARQLLTKHQVKPEPEPEPKPKPKPKPKRQSVSLTTT